MNCIVIHGCPSDEEKGMDPKTRTYDKHWIPWIKKELLSRGIKIDAPLMPEPWKPDYDAYKEEFAKYEVNEDTVLIGHSCGCAFLVRWLGETKRRIRKLVLVAPWKIPDEGDEFREKFYTYPIDGTIRSRAKTIVMFTADNEEEEGKRSLEIFHDVLGGRVIELKGMGHYTLNDMGTEAFPELLKEAIST
ncbi:Serine hydrolase [uncultured archaeon]|nr:Serine hydrolase [uncultured archaeon]